METVPPTVAVATRNYEKFSETFVRRHIENLFSGRTVVVTFMAPRSEVPNRPFHVFKPTKKLVPRWHRPLVQLFGQGIDGKVRDRNDKLLEFLNTTGASHILCEFGYVATEMEEAIKSWNGPVFCYIRGADATKYLRDRDFNSTFRRLVPELSGIVAVSRFLLDRLKQERITHPNSIVVPSGTDICRFRPGPSSGRHVLTVGRLIEKKDPLIALEAFAKVAAAYHDLRWTIVGSGPLERKLRRRIAKLGLTERISLLGALPHEAVTELMCSATVYFQAFRTAPDGDCEGMPSVIQEAMAAGRAIVTTRHAGIPEHVEDGISGLLFPERDMLGLATGLERLIASPELRLRLGAAARAHAEAELDYRILYRRLEEFMVNSTL